MIRPATLDDLDTLLQLNAVVQGWHAAHYPASFHPHPDAEQMRAFFTEMLRTDGCHILICDDDSGYLFARRHAGKTTPYGRKHTALHIEHIAVRPERQRKGIGRALMDTAESLARELGCEQLTLDTWAANTDAHAMFRTVGMAPLRHHFAKALD